MRRRRYLTTAGGWFGLVQLAGCLDVLPTGARDSPTYPGGTLVVENTSESGLQVAVTIVEDEWSSTLETTVPGEDTVVREEFVTANQGDVVTLAAVIGGDGEPSTFEFLPAGGEGDAPPEVAHLTIQNAVEASATWTATPGS